MIIYSAICGEKDKSRDDILCFTENKFGNPVMGAKVYKILAHKFLDTDISIWLDGNIFLKVPGEQLVKEWLSDADMAVFEHNHHWTMSQETEVIRKMFKSRPWIYEEVKKQLEHYKPLNLPLSMCGMIIRRHTPLVERFNEAWWAEICRWGSRDQLSFPVVLSRFPLKVNYIKGNIKNHPYLRYETHQHFNT